MPDDNNDAAIWAAASNAINQTGAYIAQTNLNKKTKEWNEQMYYRQRGDALTDWFMQNQYNSPSNQMARLKAAGLNPNLVYGHGADTLSGPVRSSSSSSWNPSVPNVGGSGTMDKYFSTQLMQAQLDNLRANNTVLHNEALLKAAQTSAVNESIPLTQTNVANRQFDLGMKNRLADTVIETALQKQMKVANEVDVMVNKMYRDQRYQDMTVQKLTSELESMAIDRAKSQAQIDEIHQRVENMRKSGILMQLEINMNNKGIQKNDPVYLRVLTQLWNNMIGNTEQGTVIPDKKPGG